MQQWTPVADFTHHAHTASLSAVAVNSRFVVTGSKDETIHIYDMKKKIEHGALVHHSGTITCLKFYGNRHLISGAEDGLICIWDAKKWEWLKSIKAHKGHVTFLSIHLSGKLALSVGTDKTLRVKAMFSFEIPEHHVIVTASSDGFIKMWKLKQNKKVRPSLLCEVNTNSRLTCLGVWLDTVPDTKASLPPAAEPSPVSKEQSKIGKKEPGDIVHKEEKQSKPNTKECSKKETQESSLVNQEEKKGRCVRKEEEKEENKKNAVNPRGLLKEPL
ncbi:p21-activated protein kinase-interacting protein 1-like protein [Saguinus oedipus]|uniref:P21-activated protein kinase-interacting protein 1-like protein n=1 Tax=Saguinus oedipus TaxID=9490 RepID=A0ABQ9VV04_SAGOE|nr:p21-activated protein kinase-interacting protein 1-like protein [Saguinus oedipus]